MKPIIIFSKTIRDKTDLSKTSFTIKAPCRSVILADYQLDLRDILCPSVSLDRLQRADASPDPRKDWRT
ncbi:hypothetical protein M2418_004998 [Rhizobium sp. BIGb0125]|jgi:hypothetical protein|nr:hypothetical protein [Rhizobium sp. BIGb0125]